MSHDKEIIKDDTLDDNLRRYDRLRRELSQASGISGCPDAFDVKYLAIEDEAARQKAAEIARRARWLARSMYSSQS